MVSKWLHIAGNIPGGPKNGNFGSLDQIGTKFDINCGYFILNIPSKFI